MIVEKGDNMSENSEYQIIPLNKLVPGETAIIVKIDSEIKEHKNHLINLGFMPGEKITPVFKSPLGDPIAYIIGRSIRIALREREAKKIFVTGDLYETEMV